MRRQQFRASTAAVRSQRSPPELLTPIYSYDSDLNPSRPVRSSPLGSSAIAGLPLELLDRLKAFPLFQSAPQSFLQSIGKSLHPNVYQPSQEIIREGEDARAMYWLVRGSVRVTSRDGESTYAELKPGSFFGEIGILMDLPRTASVVAVVRSLVVRLNKEDLHRDLPNYPDVETSIREEALERLAILARKKKERVGGVVGGGVVVGGGGGGEAGARAVDGGAGGETRTVGLMAPVDVALRASAAPRKRSRDWIAGDVEMNEDGVFTNAEPLSNKRRKSPSPGLADMMVRSVLESTPLTIRQLLKELPLFSGLPNEILHFLGVNAQPTTFAPFVDILKEGSMGRDVYFLIRGDVEVLTADNTNSPPDQNTRSSSSPLAQKVRARLKWGQYFGEVTSLSLAPRRTATVRSVNTVECLMISGDVLDELWRKCSPDLRQQVESEARRRLNTTATDAQDVAMGESGLAGGPVGGDGTSAEDSGEEFSGDWRKELPIVKLEHPDDQLSPASQMEPADPDPFFNPELDNIRDKSRRSSLAPPLGQDSPASPLVEQRTPSPPALRLLSSSPLKPRSTASTASPSSPYRPSPAQTRRSSLDRRPSNYGKARIPDSILVVIFQHLDLLDLMRFRLVSMHWLDLLSTSPDVLPHLDLSMYNKSVTDDVLINIIAPFVGPRPRVVDLCNCFHVTDEGFQALADACGDSARVWKMKSVWDVRGSAVLNLVDKAKDLEEIDLSNCRKVGDGLLARVIGWVVPDKPPAPPQQFILPSQNNKKLAGKRAGPANAVNSQLDSLSVQPPPGTVIGAPNLKRITLSYCKHITDRSMAHIAAHAADRLISLDLTRCTSVSDAGFHAWSAHSFTSLRKLVLADCTYLSEQAVVGLVGAARGLVHLDLSFCCALSDTATEVLALGLPALQQLNMAFCGSAVSDNSLRCIARHLADLRVLSVRGCVRVTGYGVEAVVDGCRRLRVVDVSQCKNLVPWLEKGGIEKVNSPSSPYAGAGPEMSSSIGNGSATGRKIRFDVVTDGRWRTEPR